MNRELLKNIVDAILLTKGVKIKKVFLFGSRAGKRNRNKNADIDIGILADRELSLRNISSISDKIEKIPTLLKIDIVDFTNRQDDFTKEALQKIEVLYEKS